MRYFVGSTAVLFATAFGGFFDNWSIFLVAWGS